MSGDVLLCKDVCSDFTVSIRSEKRDLTFDLICGKVDSQLHTIFTKGLYHDRISNISEFNILCPPAPPDAVHQPVHSIDSTDSDIQGHAEKISNIIEKKTATALENHREMLEVFSNLRGEGDKETFCHRHSDGVVTRKTTRSCSSPVREKSKRNIGRSSSVSETNYQDIEFCLQTDHSGVLIPPSLSDVMADNNPATVPVSTPATARTSKDAANRPLPGTPGIAATAKEMAFIRQSKNTNQNTKKSGNRQDSIKNDFINSISEKNMKNVSIKNFTKIQKELSTEWTWLNNKKAKQPPTREKDGKIRVVKDVKELTAEDMYQMSNAQLIASWKLSTGILENKLELITERMKIGDNLIQCYKKDLKACRTHTNTDNYAIGQREEHRHQEDMMVKIHELSKKLEILTETVTQLRDEKGKTNEKVKETSDL